MKKCKWHINGSSVTYDDPNVIGEYLGAPICLTHAIIAQARWGNKHFVKYARKCERKLNKPPDARLD
jgi:hypothetical protein